MAFLKVEDTMTSILVFYICSAAMLTDHLYTCE